MGIARGDNSPLDSGSSLPLAVACYWSCRRRCFGGDVCAGVFLYISAVPLAVYLVFWHLRGDMVSEEVAWRESAQASEIKRQLLGMLCVPMTFNVKTMFNSTRIFSALRVATVSVVLLIYGVAFGQTEESALRMVKALRLGENLAGMTYRFAKLTTTYRGIEATLGRQKADELLRAEIAVAVPKHQDLWNRNLAKAWVPLMTSEEFDSVASNRKKSPFASKFLSVRDQAGAAMKANSEPLLKIVLAEVLTGAFEKSMLAK